MNFDQANKILIDFLDNNIFLNLDVEYAIVKNDIDLLELAEYNLKNLTSLKPDNFRLLSFLNFRTCRNYT